VIHTDARFSAAIEAVVGEIEARTDAEVVVVAAPRSGSYRDLACAGGGAAATAVLGFLCWSPVVFDASWFPVDVLVVWAFVAWALDRWPALVVRLAGTERRDRQVREAARAAFVEESVHATEGRTGVLVYVSAAEGRVELLPDQGLLGRVPGAEWNALRLDARTLEGFTEGLRRLGELLAARVPATDAGGDEVANAPRVRA
jgi:putative membrane protein